MTRALRWVVSVFYVLGLALTVLSALNFGVTSDTLPSSLLYLTAVYALLMVLTYIHDWLHPR